jgi:hypothetical protein
MILNFIYFAALFPIILPNKSGIKRKLLEEQREGLLQTHLAWKGKEHQVDDILVMGIRM